MSDYEQSYDSGSSSASSPVSDYSALSASESDVTEVLSGTEESVYVPGTRHQRHGSSSSRLHFVGADSGYSGRGGKALDLRVPTDVGVSKHGFTRSSFSPDHNLKAGTSLGSQYTRTVPSGRSHRPRSRSHHRHDNPGMPRLHVSRDFLLIIGLCITLACAVVLVTRPAVTAIYDT